jgi:hypothetical protein
MVFVPWGEYKIQVAMRQGIRPIFVPAAGIKTSVEKSFHNLQCIFGIYAMCVAKLVSTRLIPKVVALDAFHQRQVEALAAPRGAMHTSTMAHGRPFLHEYP